MQNQKPTLINVIAWTTLASGIVNLIWGLAASGAVLATIIGFVCVPITILPTILGIFEIIYAAKLLSNPPQPVLPSTTIAIFEIACVLSGNIFAMVVGILALVFYNDQIVKDYFAGLNGTVPPAPVAVIPPVTPTPPAPPAEPIRYPVAQESTPPAEPTIPEPDAPSSPEPPTRPDEDTEI
jgi:hypothetical protein